MMLGVAETEETLRVEVFGVCRTYYLQVWNGAHNQVGVENSSALRKAENVYYPSAIRALGPSSSKLTLSLRIQVATRAYLIRLSPFPMILLKMQRKLGQLKRKMTQLKEWSLKLPSLQLHPKTFLRINEPSRAQKLSWQSFPCILRRIPRVRVQPPLQLLLPNLPRPQQKTTILLRLSRAQARFSRLSCFHVIVVYICKVVLILPFPRLYPITSANLFLCSITFVQNQT